MSVTWAKNVRSNLTGLVGVDGASERRRIIACPVLGGLHHSTNGQPHELPSPTGLAIRLTVGRRGRLPGGRVVLLAQRPSGSAGLSGCPLISSG